METKLEISETLDISDDESEFSFDSNIITDEDEELLAPMESLDDENEEKSTNRTIFACTICSLTFLNLMSLKNHEKWHADPEKFKCKICKSVFMAKSALRRHYLQHGNIRCKNCLNFFSDVQKLLEHHKLCSKTKPIKKPVRKDYQQDSWKCNICSKEFYCKTSVTDHQLWHKNTEAFKCEICFATFAHRRSLMYHIKNHTRTTKFNCPHCDRKFEHRDNMRKHMIMHSESMVKEHLTCKYCGKVLGLRNSRIKHEKSCLKNPANITTKVDEVIEESVIIQRKQRSNRTNRCYSCQQVFSSRIKLDKHKASKICIELSTCKYCSRVLSSKYCLIRHLQVCDMNTKKLMNEADSSSDEMVCNSDMLEKSDDESAKKTYTQEKIDEDNIIEIDDKDDLPIEKFLGLDHRFTNNETIIVMVNE